ncbi:hypothetical protein P43SY_008629 [Pythium insidiosum]|uniref:Cyclic nucleotide-binding domain-containing protein n=1 Tax=Pythium insidiosum TaxID=114742 RepID=A0AAD5Q4I1_PYTIN|nr:hypothetical protein P43SY_008629 [Pythium insidiosum]
MHPETPRSAGFAAAASAAVAGKRLSSTQARIRLTLAAATTSVSPAPADGASSGGSVVFPPVHPSTPPSSRSSHTRLNRLARSVMAMKDDSPSRPTSRQESDSGSARLDADGGNQQEGDGTAPASSDRWGDVLNRVLRKTSRSSISSAGGRAADSTRVSLSNVLKSRDVKDLVKTAIVTKHWNTQRTMSTTNGSARDSAEERSSVMEHWMKTSLLRSQGMKRPRRKTRRPTTAGGSTGESDNNGDDAENDEDGGDDEEDEDGDIESGFDVRGSAMYGRTLLLEESCRHALAQPGENRSQMDLQALKAWFQMTKLRLTTDFERLQPAELDLLCRRMTLLTFHPHEVVFRQGDDADAMYLVFSGVVEVRVAQRVLGEKIEVTVCELTKGDYFGERALLTDDPRAATIVAKTGCELVQITRKDYNIMLKADQQEFLSRLQLTGGLLHERQGGGGGAGAGGGGGQNSAHASTLLRWRQLQLSGASPASPGATGPGVLHREQTYTQLQREYVSVLNKKKAARTKSDVDMLSEYLHTLKFFRGLPKQFVRELCTVVDLLTLPPGSVVFNEGDVGDLFYIVFSGSVDVIVNSKDVRGNAQQTKLIVLTEGAHFGELALMKGHGIRSATVRTREECRFLTICERDYNATLRRMQKEDLARRVAVLDAIPMFQTPEWTGELLREMSYVLAEQKLATGHVLFQQGEKAHQVFFVVRGELLVTKEIADPVTGTTHNVVVERVGRFRVVGDEAAAGAHFNEAIFREFTVTASTPVEVLLLSKYDVFHRLSRAARETLRAAARCPVEGVVYLDRFHKTVKWDAYKQQVLREHLDPVRLRKLLPGEVKESNAMKKTKKKKKKKAQKSALPANVDKANTEATSTSVPGSPEPSAAEQTPEMLPQLVGANDFLLLDPERLAMAKREWTPLPPNTTPSTAPMPLTPLAHGTIAHHVASLNADAPPSAARRRQLERALKAERRRAVAVLNEGNPLTYFDLSAVEWQQRKQQAEVRGRAASSRRLLIHGAPSPPSASASGPASPPDTDTNGVDVAATANNVMNQFFQENFIFSRPETLRQHGNQNAVARASRLLNELEQRHGVASSSSSSSSAGGDTTSSSHRASTVPGESAGPRPCDGELVVMQVQHDDALVSPSFRLLCAVATPDAARVVMLETQIGELSEAARQELIDGEDPQVTDGSAFYVLPKRKFAVMPRASRPRATEEALQRYVLERFGRAPPPSLLAWQQRARARFGSSVGAHSESSNVDHHQQPQPQPQKQLHQSPEFAVDVSSLFASFHRLSVTLREQRETALGMAHAAAGVLSAPASPPKTTLDTAASEQRPETNNEPPSPTRQASTVSLLRHRGGSLTAPAQRLFAVCSMVLSKLELESSSVDEPLLCVHDLFTSEAHAMDQALRMGPQALKNALLCVLPVNEWVPFEEAYEWCVQVEPDRRDRRRQSSMANATNVATASPSTPPSPLRRRTGSMLNVTAGMPSPTADHEARPTWQVEKEKARRLHHFVCSRMGAKTHDRAARAAEVTGFTRRPTVTLEDKLATLHEYLETAQAATTAASSGHHGGGNAGRSSAVISRYRQMKKFGSIMRARITSHTPPSATVTNEL